jgi:acetylornithine/succinyldiaminopimelate/putrescine aminotransferase
MRTYAQSGVRFVEGHGTNLYDENGRRYLVNGLVVNAPVADAIRFAPPLVVSHEEIDEALAILEAVLA